MPEIILHIGRGKTGSTIIQRYLSQSHEHLAEHGVHYVLADGGKRGGGHQNLAKSFVTHSPDFMLPAKDPERVQNAVLEEIAASPHRTIILSSENFAIAEPELVHAYFAQLGKGFDVRILYFVRSQDEVAESEYNQVVKLALSAVSFSDYVANEIEGIDYMHVATAWERCFGFDNMICRIFDGTRDVIAQFLECIPGIDHHALGQQARKTDSSSRNESVGIRALAIALILNQIEIPNRRRFYADVFAQIAGSDLPAVLMDSSQARQLRDRFAGSNRAFTRRYLGRELADLGGRRRSDEERDNIRQQIQMMGLSLD